MVYECCKLKIILSRVSIKGYEVYQNLVIVFLVSTVTWYTRDLILGLYFPVETYRITLGLLTTGAHWGVAGKGNLGRQIPFTCKTCSCLHFGSIWPLCVPSLEEERPGIALRAIHIQRWHTAPCPQGKTFLSPFHSQPWPSLKRL